jgi:hypothetical protein
MTDETDDDGPVGFCCICSPCPLCGGETADPLDEMSTAEWQEFEAEMQADYEASLASLPPMTNEPDDIPF